MKITNVQKKLIEQLYGKGDFLEVDDILYYKVSNDNTTYRVDFDKSVYKRMDGVKQGSKDTTDKKKKIEENDLERQVHEDLTMEQVEENYWVETPETEIDGSFAMFETRVAKEMEARGIPREQARKEVKRKLAQKGVSVINTDDMTGDIDKAIDEVEEVKEAEEEEKSEDKEDFKEDMENLKKENEQLKQDLEESKKANESMKSEFKETLDFVDKMKKDYEAKLEKERQDKIKQMVNDFIGVTEDSLKDKTMKELEDTENILTMAIKKDTKDDNDETHDFQGHLDLIEAKGKELQDRYRCEV